VRSEKASLTVEEKAIEKEIIEISFKRFNELGRR
jgi:hypothetical protein